MQRWCFKKKDWSKEEKEGYTLYIILYTKIDKKFEKIGSLKKIWQKKQKAKNY